MQQWDYHTLTAGINWDADDSGRQYGLSEGELARLGSKGWELVGIAPLQQSPRYGESSTIGIQYVFKRPKAANPKADDGTSKANKKKSAPPSSEDASRIKSFGARHPESKTAKTGFPPRAQSAAAKKASSNGKH